MTSLLRIAFQGEPGTFGEEAVHQLWGADVELVSLREFVDVTEALARGDADRGILPIENTLVGSVQSSHDAIFAAPGIFATAETVVAVHHCLLGPPGASALDAQNVFCHPASLAQCGSFFRSNPRFAVHAVYDTAAGAVDVANLADPHFAVVASRLCATHHGLEVIVPDIDDRPDNQTRFLAFASASQSLPVGTPARTMLLLTTEDVPGALLDALAPLARRGSNVRRIETRPTGEPWSYRFFIEFDHQVGEADAEAVVSDVAALAHDLRVVGTFPRWAAGRRGSIGWKSGGPVPAID